jgi:hypothetical protein
MASRLGNVLNWTARLGAVFLVGFAVYLWSYEVPPKNVLDGLLLLIIAALYGLAWRSDMPSQHKIMTCDRESNPIADIRVT